jgi:voltage-gated sodium channel
MATLLFRDVAPEFFGSLGSSLFSLFQTMTLEGWPDIARTVMAGAPWAWVFFVFFILVATFMVLNLVIGIVVGAIQSKIEAEQAEVDMAADAAVLAELRALREEVADLREQLHR